MWRPAASAFIASIAARAVEDRVLASGIGFLLPGSARSADPPDRPIPRARVRGIRAAEFCATIARPAAILPTTEGGMAETASVQRRLAAILAADIAGYSR